eukprot:TRINITY_DN2596_c0_g1_i10.p2 TRINITY_DN2596_c0_g1~~TRINITY_DN2596_c0_g1_i10.p2  ORF type:complete len:111 (-),score=14.47 TRINITY_DN2596_c0_g1_i10:332-664(-)
MEYFQELAGNLEKRIALLEDKVHKQQKGEENKVQAVNMSKYVEQLKEIQKALVTSKSEIDQITIDKEQAQKQVEEQQQLVDKLKYQVNILKRSVREGDDKINQLNNNQQV